MEPNGCHALGGKNRTAVFLILGLIYVFTVLTPKIAAWIDKKRGKQPAYTQYDEHTKVKGVFEADLPKDKIRRKMRSRKTMAKDKKLVESITSMDEDFAQWYTDIVKRRS